MRCKEFRADKKMLSAEVANNQSSPMKFDILDAEKKLPIKVQYTNHSVSKVPKTLLVGWSRFTQTNV